jgi:RNA polymerase sigma-70 factor, ECF subfamily
MMSRVATGHAPVRLDPEVVGRALSGDRPAFEELYRLTVRRVYNLVMRLVGTAQEAEEVTQEVYCQVYRNLHRFEGRASFFTWVFRIATNVSLQYVKWRTRRARNLPTAALPEFRVVRASGVAFDPEREAERRTLYEGLTDCIQRLPPAQRTVMILGPIQGKSYDEMSRMLGISTNVIKGRLHRARENLRAFLVERGAQVEKAVH